jgi:hypothetical protein
LRSAVRGGHLDCVKLLVTWGLPNQPWAFDCAPYMNQVSLRPGQLSCLQHIIDQGHPIHTGVLIWVASVGELDFVRHLHSRGVALWAGAYEEKPINVTTPGQLSVSMRLVKEALRQQEVIAIPENPLDAEKMLRVLQYGWAMGAPLTPAMEELFMAKRAATRSMLLSLTAAARLSRKEGISSQQRAAWSVMGLVPQELVEKLVVRTDLETEDTFGRSRASTCSVKVQIPHPLHEVWMRNDDVLIEAFQGWAEDGLPAVRWT